MEAAPSMFKLRSRLWNFRFTSLLEGLLLDSGNETFNLDRVKGSSLEIGESPAKKTKLKVKIREIAMVMFFTFQFHEKNYPT